MRGRFPAFMIALAAIFMMACNFTTRLNEQTAQPDSQGAPTVEPLATDERPQTAFIDGRDQPEGTVNQEVVSVQPQAQLVSQSGAGGSSGSYASGGSYSSSGGNNNGGYVQSGGSYNGCCSQPPPPSYCTPRTDWAYTYVVQQGNTLSQIASAAGISVWELAQANCISNPNLIYKGQVLKVPCPIYLPPPPPPCCAPPHNPPPHYPPPVYPTYPPPVYPTVPPVVSPPVVVGSGLSISPYDALNNNTYILPPDVLITISWPATFPAATERVVFELIPPGMGSGSPIGIDTNLGDGASIVWNSVNGTQGTVRAVAYFTGGYAPQISDFYYVIAGMP